MMKKKNQTVGSIMCGSWHCRQCSDGMRFICTETRRRSGQTSREAADGAGTGSGEEHT